MSWKMAGKAKDILCGRNSEPITTTEKLLMLVIADYHNEEDGFAWPSVATLAEKCLSSVRTIQASIKHLQECGLLRVEEIRGERSRYYLLEDTPANSSGVQPIADQGVQPSVKNDGCIYNEPKGESIEAAVIAELPLPKPKKKEKVKVFKNRRSARSPNDFPDTVHDWSESHPGHATVSDMPRADVGAVWTDKIIQEFWKEFRKSFRRVVGKSPGNLFGKSLEAVRAAIERHGSDLLEKTSNKWLAQLSERDIRYMHDNPHAMGFTLHIDEWVEEFQVQPDAAPRTDPNDGLQLTDGGKKKLALFERNA